MIFTSGSTGTPKGVAVSHRSAAAFVDAEARLFLQERPLGPGDRVMAGLSVGFDASCEEMWLAWAHGACLVPAPRSLVRSGMDLGPWLVANDVTVVSTVPTLVSLWPTEALAAVRLLILGGEACPPEIGARLATPDREVWNTYGPTEATVVACAARLTGTPPVRIGLPLDGWDLAVVDAQGRPVRARRAGRADHRRGRPGAVPRPGEGRREVRRRCRRWAGTGPTAAATWCATTPEGLVFIGRADDQVKIGGRRIELGEIDSALLAVPGVTGAAAAVRSTSSGNKLLVGYVAVDDTFDLDVGHDPAALGAARRAGAAAGPRRRPADEDVGEDRPRRAAVAAPVRGVGGESARAAPARPAGSRTSGATSSARSADGRRRLLRPRRRQPDGRPGRGPAARALPRGHGRRPLRAPDARGPRRLARRDGRPALPAEPPGRARSRSRRRRARSSSTLRAAHPDGPALADLARRRQQPGGRPPRPRLAAPRCRGGGWPSAGCCWSPRRDGCSSPRPAPGCCCAASAPGATPAAARSTCGCGWPSGSPTRWAPPTWPAPPGCASYARALGAEVGRHVDLHAIPPVTGMLDARRRLLDRARGRPARALDRRRRPAPRADARRTRRPRRRAQHAAARARTSGTRAEIAPGLGRLRRRAGRRGVVGRPGPGGRRRTRPLGRRPAGQPPALAGGVRASWPSLISALPVLAIAGRRRGRGAGGVGTRTRSATAARAVAVWSPVGVVVGYLALAVLVWALRPPALAGGSSRDTTRSTAGRPGRPGRCCGSWTRPAPGSSRSTPARSRRRGCAPSAPRSARTSRPRRCC